MTKQNRNIQVEWYRGVRPRYEALAVMIASTIQSLLKHAKIDFVSVTHRAKEIDSFTEKLRRKRYKDPETEMTDLAGVRIVNYIERDVQRTCEVVEKAFNRNKVHSLDKTEELGVDRFGYKSIHFVCDIGNTRSLLPEFSSFSNIPFEIQIRTALQHTWAEVEHDRNYKYGGTLPAQLKRRLYLVAGLLELADREFNELTEEIEEYSAKVESDTRAGNLNVEINSPSVVQYLNTKLESISSKMVLTSSTVDEKVISELKLFGVNSLADLDRLISMPLLKYWVNTTAPQTYAGILRDTMMYSDVDVYFTKAWMNGWSGWDTESMEFLVSKYGRSKIESLVAKYEIDLTDDEQDGSGGDDFDTL